MSNNDSSPGAATLESIAEVANSSEKIPVNGVSVSRATDTLPPCLVAFLGVDAGNFYASLAPPLLLSLLLPQATNANAAAETTPSPNPAATPTEPNTLDNFILCFPHLGYNSFSIVI